MMWAFFGCVDGQSGHKLVGPNGDRWLDKMHPYIRENLGNRFDDTLRPFVPLKGTLGVLKYQACVSRLGGLGYSALSWVDNSVDSRPGSNAIVFAPSLECSAESMYCGFVKYFPDLEKRFRREERVNPEWERWAKTPPGGDLQWEREPRREVVVDRRVWIPGSNVSEGGRTYFRDEANNMIKPE